MARKRRGRSEGGVYQRESDGKWVGAVDAGRSADGRRRRRVVYGETKAEVLTKLRDLQRRQDAHAIAEPSIAEPSNLTVAAFLSHWMKTTGDPESSAAESTSRGTSTRSSGASASTGSTDCSSSVG
jgi:hypothetical protein